MIVFSQRTGETNGCCNIRTIQKKIISGLPIEQKNAGMYAAKRTFRHFFVSKLPLIHLIQHGSQHLGKFFRPNPVHMAIVIPISFHGTGQHVGLDLIKVVIRQPIPAHKFPKIPVGRFIAVGIGIRRLFWHRRGDHDQFDSLFLAEPDDFFKIPDCFLLNFALIKGDIVKGSLLFPFDSVPIEKPVSAVMS